MSAAPLESPAVDTTARQEQNAGSELGPLLCLVLRSIAREACRPSTPLHCMHCGDRSVTLGEHPRSLCSVAAVRTPKISSRTALSACLRPLAAFTGLSKSAAAPAVSHGPGCRALSVRASELAKTMGKRDNNDLSAANTTASVQVRPTSRQRQRQRQRPGSAACHAY